MARVLLLCAREWVPPLHAAHLLGLCGRLAPHSATLVTDHPALGRELARRGADVTLLERLDPAQPTLNLEAFALSRDDADPVAVVDARNLLLEAATLDRAFELHASGGRVVAGAAVSRDIPLQAMNHYRLSAMGVLTPLEPDQDPVWRGPRTRPFLFNWPQHGVRRRPEPPYVRREDGRMSPLPPDGTPFPGEGDSLYEVLSENQARRVLSPALAERLSGLAAVTAVGTLGFEAVLTRAAGRLALFPPLVLEGCEIRALPVVGGRIREDLARRAPVLAQSAAASPARLGGVALSGPALELPDVPDLEALVVLLLRLSEEGVYQYREPALRGLGEWRFDFNRGGFVSRTTGREFSCRQDTGALLRPDGSLFVGRPAQLAAPLDERDLALFPLEPSAALRAVDEVELLRLELLTERLLSREVRHAG